MSQLAAARADSTELQRATRDSRSPRSPSPRSLPLFVSAGEHRAAQHDPRGGLRGHGARPEHRRRLRRPARPRLRRVLRDRRARHRVLRLRVLGERRRLAPRRTTPACPASTSTSCSSSCSRRSPQRSRASLIGLPTLRLRGDYVGIVTLAFGEIIGQARANGREIHFLGGTLTGGPNGHLRRSTGSTSRSLDRFGALDLRPWYWFALALVALTLVVNFRLRDSRLGRAWVALRDDEVAAGVRGRPDRAHEAARLRRGRRARRRGRRLPRLVPEHRRTRTSSRSRSRSSSSPWSCSAGWARSGASSSARSSCR